MCETATDTDTTASVAHRRYDISDHDWEIVAPHLPGSPGSVGRPAQDNRRFINAVFWILRTGAPWRDLPPEYGHWNTTARRFGRWQKNGHWARLLAAVSDDPDFEWLTNAIAARNVKVHQPGTGAAGGNQATGNTEVD